MLVRDEFEAIDINWYKYLVYVNLRKPTWIPFPIYDVFISIWTIDKYQVKS